MVKSGSMVTGCPDRPEHRPQISHRDATLRPNLSPKLHARQPKLVYSELFRASLEQKQYMLELINGERTKAGVPMVALGENVAAQLHAEEALAGCYASHWGADGLKPYMRYSLAGGYQSNGENGSG